MVPLVPSAAVHILPVSLDRYIHPSNTTAANFWPLAEDAIALQFAEIPRATHLLYVKATLVGASLLLDDFVTFTYNMTDPSVVGGSISRPFFEHVDVFVVTKLSYEYSQEVIFPTLLTSQLITGFQEVEFITSPATGEVILIPEVTTTAEYVKCTTLVTTALSASVPLTTNVCCPYPDGCGISDPLLAQVAVVVALLSSLNWQTVAVPHEM